MSASSIQDPPVHVAYRLPARPHRTDNVAAPAPVDAWPNTTRLLPWTVAAFLVMLWLMPFQAVVLPFSLPFDSRIDRIALLAIAVVWIVCYSMGRSSAPVWRPNAMNSALAAFMTVVGISLILNSELLARVGGIELGTKKAALMVSLCLFFVIAVTVIRPEEVSAFVKLCVGLASLTAIGTIYEYRTGFDVFYVWTDTLMPGPIYVAPAPADAAWGRPTITGPTGHGLAATTLIGMAVPFAVTGLMWARTNATKIVYGLATAVLLAGIIATVRKTAVIVPLAPLLVLLIYRPAKTIRWAPFAVVLVIFMQGVAPGALTAISSEFTHFNVNSTTDRQNDYDAVSPDILAHPVFGRGFGTYNPHEYRFLDNQYLAMLIETGIVGLAAYLLLSVVGMMVAHRGITSGNAKRAGPALAASGAVAAFAVSNFLFDTLAYPQVPYIFLFAVALAVICASQRGRPAGSRAPAARLDTSEGTDSISENGTLRRRWELEPTGT